MTRQAVINGFNDIHPRKEKDVLVKCGVPIVFLGAGAFRTAYAIPGTSLVVKIPHCYLDIHHAQREFRILRKIKSRKKLYEGMKRYLPVIYYTNRHTGVSVMKKYKEMPLGKRSENRCDAVGKKISALMGLGKLGWDHHNSNFGTDASGQIVVLDLGCLEGYPCD